MAVEFPQLLNKEFPLEELDSVPLTRNIKAPEQKAKRALVEELVDTFLSRDLCCGVAVFIYRNDKSRHYDQ